MKVSLFNLLKIHGFINYISAIGDCSRPTGRPLLLTLVDITSCNDVIKPASPRCQCISKERTDRVLGAVQSFCFLNCIFNFCHDILKSVKRFSTVVKGLNSKHAGIARTIVRVARRFRKAYFV